MGNTVKIFREIEMPKSCYKCKYCYKDGVNFPTECTITEKHLNDYYVEKKRDKSCPLKPGEMVILKSR